MHLKDINRKSISDQGNLPFQIKNKQKKTVKDSYHNVSAFIDLINNDLEKKNDEKNEKSKTQRIQRETKSNERTWKKRILLSLMQTMVVL